MLPTSLGTVDRLRLSQSIDQEAGHILVTVADGYRPLATVSLSVGSPSFVTVDIDGLRFVAETLDQVVEILGSHYPLTKSQQDNILERLQAANTAHLLTISIPVADAWLTGYLTVGADNRPQQASFSYSADSSSESVEGEFGRVHRSISRLLTAVENQHPELTHDRIFTSFASWFQSH